MLSYNQIDQLKVVGQITNADYLLLCCLMQYPDSMQTAYLKTADLANADMDSNKIESGLRELESKGIIFFQASSIIITWANPTEEERLDLTQIQDQLSSGILNEKQSFYYEILLQKTAGASLQTIDPYNWTGTISYEPRQITKLIYELNRESSKFTTASNDWLIEWQKGFSEFVTATPPTGTPVNPMAAVTAFTPSLASGIASTMNVTNIRYAGNIIADDHLVLVVNQPDGTTYSAVVHVVNGVTSYVITPQVTGVHSLRINFTSGVLVSDLGNFTV